MQRGTQVFLRRCIVGGAVFAVAVAVAILPVFFTFAGSVQGADWGKLSYIGQTYGAASAMMSALGLIGVAASLVIQTRQVRLGQMQAARMQQLSLMDMAMRDPVLSPLWQYGPSTDIEEARRRSFLQLTF